MPNAVVVLGVDPTLVEDRLWLGGWRCIPGMPDGVHAAMDALLAAPRGCLRSDDVELAVCERLELPPAAFRIVAARPRRPQTGVERCERIRFDELLDAAGLVPLRNLADCMRFLLATGLITAAFDGACRWLCLSQDPSPVWELLLLTPEESEVLQESIGEPERSVLAEQALDALLNVAAPVRPTRIGFTMSALARRMDTDSTGARVALTALVETFPATLDASLAECSDDQRLELSMDWSAFDANWMRVSLSITSDS
jgi:hypothetical protein